MTPHEEKLSENEEWDAYWKEVDAEILRRIIAYAKGTRLRGVQRFKTPNKILLRRRQLR